MPIADSMSERTISKRMAFKKEAVRRLGGSCMRCGDTRHYVLNFHHLDPSEKEETPSTLLASSKWEEFLRETVHCILLCSNCHQEFHFLEVHEGLKIEDYVDLTSFAGQEQVVIEQPSDQRLKCSQCGIEISPKRKSGTCESCSRMLQRVVKDRPSREELKNLIRTEPMTVIARKYGISDNAVRKWCDAYGLPRKKTIIQQMTDEEWESV